MALAHCDAVGWIVNDKVCPALLGGIRIMTIVRELLKDESGASMAEYAMLLALIAVACIGAVTALRNQIIGVFDSSATALGAAQ